MWTTTPPPPPPPLTNLLSKFPPSQSSSPGQRPWHWARHPPGAALIRQINFEISYFLSHLHLTSQFGQILVEQVGPRRLADWKMTDNFMIIFISILGILFFFPGIFCISEEQWGNSFAWYFLFRPTRKSPGSNIKEEMMQLWTVFLSDEALQLIFNVQY